MTFTTTTTATQNGISQPGINFNKSLGEVDIIISLSSQLSDRKEFAAICIRNAIKSPMSCKEIITTVKDMVTDNPQGMRTILGNTLTDKIISYEL